MVFNRQESRDLLESILGGTLPFPFGDTCGILLHGVAGTGKTTLGKGFARLARSGRPSATDSLHRQLHQRHKV
jgi:SpoVK/Ycf46/Vps4 family AAA+-type ATPase